MRNLFLFALLIGSVVYGQVDPNLRGFGVNTPGGRGGEIYIVSNLNDSGPGSLREALEASGKRVVLFSVSGVIDLKDRIEIQNPFVSVFGSTSPASGICIRGTLVIVTHDVFLQHLSIRQWPGEDYSDPVSIGYGGGYDVNNVVLDHCSVSFGRDEILEIATEYGDQLTISNCILTNADNLSNAGYGPLVRGKGRIAFLGNIFANSRERAPLTSTDMVYINNVVYNQYQRQISIEGERFSLEISISNNIFLQKDNDYLHPPIHFADKFNKSSKIFIEANFWDQLIGDNWWNTKFMYNPKKKFRALSPPLKVDNFFPEVEEDSIFIKTLARAGSKPAFRNSFDEKLIEGIKKGTSDKGTPNKFPNYKRENISLELPENPNGGVDLKGYNNLDRWVFAQNRIAEGEIQIDEGEDEEGGDGEQGKVDTVYVILDPMIITRTPIIETRTKRVMVEYKYDTLVGYRYDTIRSSAIKP